MGDVDYLDEAPDYIDDDIDDIDSNQSEGSDGDMSDDLENNLNTLNAPVIERYGDDRTTDDILTEYEFANCLEERAKQLNEGAKAIIPVSNTESIKIATKEILYSVRPNPRVIFDPEFAKHAAPLEVTKEVSYGVYDIWQIHELVYMKNNRGDVNSYDDMQSMQSLTLDNEDTKFMEKFIK